MGRLLHKQLLRKIDKLLAPGLRDQHRLAAFKPVGFQPDARHEMKGHPRRQHGFIAGPQADGVLAPVRHVVEAERIPDPRRLDEARVGNGFAPAGLDFFGGHAGLDEHQDVFQAGHHRVCGLPQIFRWSPQIQRAGQGGMVVVPGPGDFKEHHVARLVPPIRIVGQMGRGGSLRRGHDWEDGRW